MNEVVYSWCNPFLVWIPSCSSFAPKLVHTIYQFLGRLQPPLYLKAISVQTYFELKFMSLDFEIHDSKTNRASVIRPSVIVIKSYRLSHLSRRVSSHSTATGVAFGDSCHTGWGGLSNMHAVINMKSTRGPSMFTLWMFRLFLVTLIPVKLAGSLKVDPSLEAGTHISKCALEASSARISSLKWFNRDACIALLTTGISGL